MQAVKHGYSDAVPKNVADEFIAATVNPSKLPEKAAASRAKFKRKAKV